MTTLVYISKKIPILFSGFLFQFVYEKNRFLSCAEKGNSGSPFHIYYDIAPPSISISLLPGTIEPCPPRPQFVVAAARRGLNLRRRRPPSAPRPRPPNRSTRPRAPLLCYSWPRYLKLPSPRTLNPDWFISLVSPLLEGTYLIRRPIDEFEAVHQKANLGKFSPEKGRTFLSNLLDKPEPGTCNVCYAPSSYSVHHSCPLFLMESEGGSAPTGFTSTVKEADSGSSSKRSDAFCSKSLDGERHSSEHRNNDISCFSEAKGTSNVAVRKKRGRRAPPSSRSLRGEKADKVIRSDDAVDNYNHVIEEGQAGKSQSISHAEECVDERTGGLDLPKTGHSGHSGNSSDVASTPSSRKTEEQDDLTNSKDLFGKACPQTAEMVVERPTGNEKSFWAEKENGTRRSQQYTLHAKQDGVDREPIGQSASANEMCNKSNALGDASYVQAAAVMKTIAVNKTSEEIMGDGFNIQLMSDAQVNTTSSEDKSSEEVEDVKVCDICGDVGEEEKLAVCNRCNDGAEHIYCMRVMMKEVPEGEWLCEECQTEVEFEKEKNLEKSQVKVGASKGQSFEGKTNKPCNAAKSRNSSENEMEAENVGNKESNKANQGNDMATKRKEEDAGITSSVRQNLAEPVDLSMGADSRKRVPLSRESSFKLDTEKGRQPTPQASTSLASNAAKNQAPSLCGQLSKSTSFNNSKIAKVKQLVNEVPQKPKNLKDHLPCITKKEGRMGLSTKSESFKKPKSCEPANKEKSSIIPPAEEPRVMNSLVSRNVSNDRGTSILGCPSVTGSMAIPDPSKAESAAQYLTTGNNMADSNNLGIAHGQGGHSELKKQLLAKASGTITLTSAERSSGILGSGAQRKVIQISDPSHREDKVKDPPSLRHVASGSSRTMRCQRCNEVGHSTQFCAVDKVRLSAIKPLSERNLKDSSAKRNKMSEATSLVATEKAASRSADHSEHVLKCGPYHNPIYKPKDVLSTSFSHVKKPSQLYVRTEQDTRNSLCTPSSTASTDCSKLKFKEHQTLSATTARSVDSSSTMSSDLIDKSSQGFSPGDELIVSTVPELDCIWQGGFELWRTGRSPELCDGFQAHLSCSASPKVLEVAKKFPSKVQLEELPRKNSWPTQFQENGPTYDNIGLFFFARDTQSYENHYSKLVKNMLNNDLALRGNIETAELLIFPSNILSKNFQRWNMFYFLWGVFRVRRKDLLNLPPDVPISKLQPNLNEDPLAVDLSTSVLSASCSFSEDQNNGAESDLNLVKSATCADYQSLQTSEANHQGHLNGENTSNQTVGGRDLEDHHHDSIKARCSTNNSSAINDFSTVLARKHQKLAYSEDQDKVWDPSGGNTDVPFFYANMVPVTCSISSIHEEGKESTKINLNNAENLMDVEHVNTTEVNSGTVDLITHVGDAHKRNVEMANWAGGVNGTLEHKKIKLDNVGWSNTSLNENIRDGRLSSKVHPLAASSVDDCTDNKAIAGSSKSNGKCIFPLDLNAVDDAVAGNIVNILSSDEEDLPECNAPDLELELGDNKSPRKPMFSFLSPKVGDKQNKRDSLLTDTPGSLSLSLAFPASKEQVGKLQSESQRQLPDGSSRNKLSSIWDQQ